MEKKKTTEQKKTDRQDSVEYLKQKKAKDGKLSKIGEWMLSEKGKTLGWEVAPENMKYILK